MSTDSRHPTRFIRVIASMLALTAAAGCSRSVTPAVEDAQLLVRVRTAIVNDADLGPQDIGIRASGGTVHLTGVVRSDDDITQAIALVRTVSGVRDVTSELQIASAALGETLTRRFRPNRTGGATEPEPWPSFLAIGASVGVSQPGEPLRRGISGGPQFALRPGSGFGTPIAFNWYRGELATDAGNDSFGHLRIRPIMGGVSYSFVRDRLSLGPSLVAGFAFNSLSINESLESDLRAVAVDNSLVARVGVGIGYRLTRRVSLTGFLGRLFTRPGVTFVDPDGVFTRTVNADTTQITLGFAYWLF